MMGSGSGGTAGRHEVLDERLGLGVHGSTAAVHHLLHIGDHSVQRRVPATLMLRLQQVSPQDLGGGGQPQTGERRLSRVLGSRTVPRTRSVKFGFRWLFGFMPQPV